MTQQPPDRDGGRRRHPDLAGVLLAHAIELARTSGPGAVSLRDVQRRAGVSHAAAYRHYADREALLAAISRHASAQMAEAITDAQQHTRPESATRSATTRAQDARARFRATGQAYLTYALTEPGLFRTAFLADTIPSDPADPVPEARGSQGLGPYQLLMQCLDDMVTAGALPAERRPFSDVAAWSAVHGLAVLLLDGPLRHFDSTQRDAAISRLLDIVAAGT